MSFLIPAAQPNPSGIARFGRLLHWCALAVATVLLWAAWMAWNHQPEPITLAHLSNGIEIWVLPHFSCC